MKKITALLLTVLLIFSLSACGKGSNEVVAKVNDRVITLNEYNKTLAMYKKNYENIYGPEIWTKEASKGKTFIEIVKEQVLNKMVDDEIVYQHTQKEKIKVDEKEVQKQLSQFKTQVDKNPDFKKFLSDNGIDDEFIKEQIRKDISVSKFKSDYIQSLGINDEKVKAFYEENKDKYTKEEVKASHILITTVKKDENGELVRDASGNLTPLPDAEVKKAEQKAKDILVRAKNGEDFASLAKQYSEDKGSAANGGDLGYFEKGVMVKEFANVAFSLKPGEMSDLVKTDYGYHIIKVEDHVNRVEEFETQKETIAAQMQDNAYLDKIEELKKAAKVEEYKENIKEK